MGAPLPIAFPTHWSPTLPMEREWAESETPFARVQPAGLASPAAAAHTTLPQHLKRAWQMLRTRDWEGLRLQRSLLPYAITCAPLLITNVLGPPWLAWLMGVLCALALYRVTQSLDELLFEASPQRGFLGYALPLNLLLALWCLAMAAADKTASLPTTAFAWTALLALAVAPACRWSARHRHRRLPLRLSFGVMASLVLVAQGLAAVAELGWMGVAA
jgi:hypothetical protein